MRQYRVKHGVVKGTSGSDEILPYAQFFADSPVRFALVRFDFAGSLPPP